MACVLEASEGGGTLECLEQRVDSFGSVRSLGIIVDAADSGLGEAAKVVHAQC